MAQKKKKKISKYKQERSRNRLKERKDGRKPEASDSDAESDGDNSGFEEIDVMDEQYAPQPQDEVDQDMSDLEETDTRKLVQQQNRKKKKSGGFQSMGLSHPVFTGVLRKGYKVPTPIQRKTIPLIMDGKDVVAMARTGSGKTAAFLIPMFEKLKCHQTIGVRALILSPTRELALQTLKFAKEIGKYTGLRSAVILGGDSLDNQFAALHESPDIILATPGRFTHVLVEMELKLNSVEYIVFDEADRLFEMGFQEQLQEILGRLPESRQTVLFSATLPKLMVEFARAGLHDPTLIRLDIDTKLSENLKLCFLQSRPEDKMATLLYILRNIVKSSEQTVIFVATKHHVEYTNMILKEAGMDCSYTYSSLDQTARKIQVAKFRSRKTSILIVTDLAARGIDIPMLDNVINFNFPAKPKLFVHRVGRVARAGRSGTAYSLISGDEMAHLLDLHLFLGRPLKFVENTGSHKGEDGLYGTIPQSVIDDEESNLIAWRKQIDISNMKKVIENAYKHYMKSRPPASTESIKRAKELAFKDVSYHPLFESELGNMEDLRSQVLSSMKNFRPRNTIFEINSTSKTLTSTIMKEKRNLHGKVIEAQIRKKKEVEMEKEEIQNGGRSIVLSNEDSTAADIEEAFGHILGDKRTNKSRNATSKKPKAPGGKSEFYLHYKPHDFQSEKGYSIGSSFEKDAASAQFNIGGDEERSSKNMENATKWDRKRKKFVRDGGNDPKKKKVPTATLR